MNLGQFAPFTETAPVRPLTDPDFSRMCDREAEPQERDNDL